MRTMTFHAALALFTIACSTGAQDTQGLPVSTTENPPTNVLVVIADDLGIDVLQAYGVQPQHAPSTPTIDGLINDGVMFQNAYASPSCSPARSAILTGRYGRRTGLGQRIALFGAPFSLALDEVTLPEMLRRAPRPWNTSMVGKWHLANFSTPNWTTHAADQGFHWHAGSQGNLNISTDLSERDYDNWEKNTNGQITNHTEYATTDTVDDAITRAAKMEEPWLLYLAFNAPHEPFHQPPEPLGNGAELDDRPGLYRDMVHAMDLELGRLLESLPTEKRERTTVIFVGDNGTPGAAVLAPLQAGRAKATLYEGGTHVPLIISGPAVQRPGSTSNALVSVVDLFPTVADLAGVDLSTVVNGDGDPIQIDGFSLLPYLENPQAASIRDHVYTERFFPNGGGPFLVDDQALRDHRYKLLRRQDLGTLELFDLSTHFPEDGPNLLEDGITPEEQEIVDRLEAQLDALQASVPYDHG